MILTCPNCATKFSVPDGALGPDGRKVRCSQCSETWFAREDAVFEPEEPAPAEPEVSNPPRRAAPQEAQKIAATEVTQPHIPAEKITESTVEYEGETGGKSFHFQQSDTDVFVEDKDEAEKILKEMSPHGRFRERANRRKVSKKKRNIGMMWLIPLIGLPLLLIALYLFRGPLVGQFPGLQKVYSAFNVEASPGGLTFYNIELRHGENEGTPTLFVTGRIKNYGGKQKDVPLIRLSFKDNAGTEIASWVTEPKQETLDAGKTMEFTSYYPNPPVEGVTLAPSFIDDSIQP